MSKKGQVTVFIIIGIVILGIVATGLYFTKERANVPVNPEEVLTLTQVSDSVSATTQNCLTLKLKDTVDLVSIQGGYFGAPTEFLKYSVDNVGGVLYIPYYIKDNEDLGITKEKYESSISYGLEKAAKKCFDFRRYPYNITVELDQIKVKTSIEAKQIKSIVEVPLRIIVGNSVKEINSFTVSIKSKADEMYNLADNITKQQYEAGEVVCFSCLPEIMSDYSVNVNTIQTEDKDNYIILYDLQDLEQENSFVFAHSINKEKSNTSFAFEEIPSLNAKAGTVFEYTVNVPPGFNVYDDSDLFEITPEGKIQFTPSEEDKGEQIITIGINNSENKQLESIFTLLIE